jgi:hypothetical protein
MELNKDFTTILHGRVYTISRTRRVTHHVRVFDHEDGSRTMDSGTPSGHSHS